MHKACTLSELAPGEALWLDTAPPIAVFHTEDGNLFDMDDTCTDQDALLAEGMWSIAGWSARYMHPASNCIQAKSIRRQPSGRSEPMRSWVPVATSWSSSSGKPPTFLPAGQSTATSKNTQSMTPKQRTKSWL